MVGPRGAGTGRLGERVVVVGGARREGGEISVVPRLALAADACAAGRDAPCEVERLLAVDSSTMSLSIKVISVVTREGASLSAGPERTPLYPTPLDREPENRPPSKRPRKTRPRF